MNMNIYAKCVKIPNNTNQDMQDKRTMMVLYRSPEQTDLHIYC